MKDFVAFRALVELLKEDKKMDLLDKAYKEAKEMENMPAEKVKNVVVPLYKEYSQEEISKKIAEILTPKEIKPKVEIIYQTIEGLHNACPGNIGDWYFSGNYPTPGGNRVVNRAFANFMENKDVRAY